MSEVSPLSWPWYITGPLLGLFVPLLAITVNKQLGVSSGFRAFWALFTQKPNYFNYDYKKDIWQLFFAVGLVLSGIILYALDQIPESIPIAGTTISKLNEIGVSDTLGLAPKEVYSFDSWWLLLIGGIAVGFGARLGNGCTSGHCIMGISQFSLASIITTIFFFVGGLIATYFIIPILL